MRKATKRELEYIAAAKRHDLNYQKMSEDLGVSKMTAYKMVFDLRKEGLFPVWEPTMFRSRLADKTMCIGSLNIALRRSDKRLQNWLAKSIPTNGSVVDFLLSIAIDAMDEDEQQEMPK